MTASIARGRALARGIRNHNPGNLRRSADPWQGLAAEQTDWCQRRSKIRPCGGVKVDHLWRAHEASGRA